jgi:ferredoxin-NADP reductase
MPTQRLLFVAGGTGIAPLRAMIDHVLRGESAHRLSLLYSARNGEEFAFIEELRGTQTGGRLELHQTVTRDDGAEWAGKRGRIGRSHFESVVHDPADTLCFRLRPASDGERVRLHACGLGVPAGAIRPKHGASLVDMVAIGLDDAAIEKACLPRVATRRIDDATALTRHAPLATCCLPGR